jgi:DNA-directed RNA polymerase subunit RPC12/RpoP
VPKRSWRNNPFIGFGLVAIAVVAAWLTYREVRQPRGDVKYSYVLKCTNCGKVFIGSYSKGEKAPFVCPYCKEKQAYLYVQCRLCMRRFALEPGSTRSAPYFCRYCGKFSAFPVEPGEVSLDEESSKP